MGWFAIFIVAVMVWIWWDGLGAKEVAHKESKRLCQLHDVLLLDDTVALRRMRLSRHRNGRIGLYRRFVFEFTSDGDQRYKGHIDMLGEDILQTYMDTYRI